MSGGGEVDGEGRPRGGGVSARLKANEKRILDLWVERVRERVEHAAEEDRPILIDSLPLYLHHLEEALSPSHPRAAASQGTSVPTEHGGERARLTRYAPDEVIHEYQLLREVLLETLSEDAPLADRERAIIIRSVDEAVRQACAAYFTVHDSIREQLVAALTHDLRNPLTAARAGASLILRNWKDERVPRWAARVVDNLDRADGMIRDILDATRLRAGERLSLSLTECDLVAVARDAISHLETVHGERFNLVAPAPVRGCWSPDALHRAIENLGGNAVKYGSEDGQITVTVREIEGRAMLTVHNWGSHITPEEQKKLFRAFRRTRRAITGGKRGWGLGLTLVRGVAESHGGSIDIDSLPESGTTFILNLPLDAGPYQES